MDNGQAMLTTEEVAILLRLTTAGVRQLARKGRIPCLKIGQEFRFRSSTLLRWLDTLERQFSDDDQACHFTSAKIHRSIGLGYRSQASEQCKKALGLQTE